MHPSKQNIKVAVDNCIFTVKEGKLHIILIQMKREPFTSQWAIPGGLVNHAESLDSAAKRVLHEETGVSDVYLEQLCTFGEPKRDPIGHVISTAYFALIPSDSAILKTNKKYLDVAWVAVSDVPRLAYDHNAIVKYAKQRLQWKLEYTNVVWSLLSKYFTLSEMQAVYEAILDRKLDKRNFQKKILGLCLIEKTEKTSMKGAHRPAVLYKFISQKPKIVNIL